MLTVALLVSHRQEQCLTLVHARAILAPLSVTGNSEKTTKGKVVGERSSKSFALLHRLSFLKGPWEKVFLIPKTVRVGLTVIADLSD